MFPGSKLPVNICGAQGKRTSRGPCLSIGKLGIHAKKCSIKKMFCRPIDSLITGKPNLDAEFSHSLEFQTRTHDLERVVLGSQLTPILSLSPRSVLNCELPFTCEWGHPSLYIQDPDIATIWEERVCTPTPCLP